MIKRIITLLFVISMSLLDATENDVIKGCMISLAGAAVAVTAWRVATAHQDQQVLNHNAQKLGQVEKYKFLVFPAGRERREKNIEKFALKIVGQGQPILHYTVQQIIQKDLRIMQELNNLDLWVRSWFNPCLNQNRVQIHHSIATIMGVEKFLLKTHQQYLHGRDLLHQAQGLQESATCILNQQKQLDSNAFVQSEAKKIDSLGNCSLVAKNIMMLDCVNNINIWKEKLKKLKKQNNYPMLDKKLEGYSNVIRLSIAEISSSEPYKIQLEMACPAKSS